MSTFSDLLAAIGLAPKTLPQAKETLDNAKATLDSVAALFTAADLNLEQMLAAGPDALKAHLDSLDNSEELAEALQENERLEADLKTASDAYSVALSIQAAHHDCFKALGISVLAEDFTPDKIKAAFSDHVTKQVTLALAKTGHPPAHVPAATEPVTASKTDAEIAAQYRTMKAGPERLAFFAQHEAALTRFAQSLRKPE